MKAKEIRAAPVFAAPEKIKPELLRNDKHPSRTTGTKQKEGTLTNEQARCNDVLVSHQSTEQASERVRYMEARR